MSTSATVDRPALLKKIRALSIFTIVYNILEGIVSIYFGISEASSSLVAFGADSFIETFSAMVVLWSFSRTDHHREETALKLISGLFFILGALTITGSALQFYHRGHPETTLPGVIISCISLGFMFFLYYAKMDVGTKLQSQTILKDAACSMACIQLSAVLLAGSAIYALAPQLWWVDAAAALGIAYFIFKEGRETYLESKGMDCCDH